MTSIFQIKCLYGCININETRHEAYKLALWSNIETDKLMIDFISNDIRKRGVNKNSMKKQDNCDKLQKSVQDKVKNITAEDINKKSLLGFLCT